MRFLLRRLGFFLATMWATLTINFLLPRLLPGDPALAMLAKYRSQLTPKTLDAINVLLGIDKHENLVVAYFGYLRNCFTLNFGRSFAFFPLDVRTVLGQALPWTLGLVGVTTVLAFILGTLIGMLSAWRRGGWLDNFLPPIFVITSALPFFFVAVLLLFVFSVTLDWLPGGFGADTTLDPGLNLEYIGSVFSHSILPGLALLITTIGVWILTMRNTMIATLAEDYVRMARAKGLSSRRIMFTYAGRNAILPNLTGFAISLGFIVSGAILVEFVFNYPGVGYMLLRAVNNQDYPLMQALFLLITVGVLVAVLIADFITMWLDPRTRAEA